MTELVRPVLLELFQKHRANLQDADITEPVFLQITKFRSDPGILKLRLSDGQFSVAATPVLHLEAGFGELQRVVKLTKFKLGLTTMPHQRLYVRIDDWEDAAPCNQIIGHPSGLTIAHVFGEQGAAETAPPASSTPSTASAPKAAPKRKDLVSIESVSPFVHKWTILARASKKSDVRTFSRNQTDEKGRLFNCIFTDETGDISATAFGDRVDEFYDKIVDGQQYYLTGLDVRKANAKFNSTSHDFELMFSRDSKVEPAGDAQISLPTVFFKFVPSIAELAKIPIDSTVDVAGVALRVNDVQTITSRSSNIPYTKRDIVLADDSGAEITLTLWGVEAEEFNSPVGTVVAVKGARLGEFRGRTLSATRSAQVVLDPDEKTAHKLKGWWKATSGTDVKFQPVADVSSGSRAPRLTINGIVSERHGMSANAEFFEVKARVATIYSRNVAYPSCTNGDCRKKVVDTGAGWRCEKCDVTISEPRYRYMLTFVVSDATCEDTGLQVSVFDEVGHILYGDRALEFQTLLDNGGDGFNAPLSTALKCIQGEEFIWNVKGSLDVYMGQERTRYTASSVRKPEPIEEGSTMLAEMGF